jgi:hypothetical protein
VYHYYYHLVVAETALKVVVGVQSRVAFQEPSAQAIVDDYGCPRARPQQRAPH